MTTDSALKPDGSLIAQLNDCVCPSFSKPVDPPTTMLGPSTSSSITVAARDALDALPGTSVALTLIWKSPSPSASMLHDPLAAAVLEIEVPMLVMVTSTPGRTGREG